MAVKSTFRSSNPSESFQSTTFQFSLGKVCLALQKFHKAQTSHQHATDAPPTHLIRYKFKEWSTVGRLSADCRPTVGRLSADCRPTCWPTRRWDRILYLYQKMKAENNGKRQQRKKRKHGWNCPFTLKKFANYHTTSSPKWTIHYLYNTIMHLFNPPQNFAYSLFAISPGTWTCPKSNLKQCLCKFLGGKRDVLWDLCK